MERMKRIKSAVNKVKVSYNSLENKLPINDSPARSYLTVAALGVIGIIGAFTLDFSWQKVFGHPTGISFPNTFMRGHTADFIGGSAITALYARKMSQDTSVISPMLLQIGANSSWEILQGLHIIGGVYDVKDFIAYIGGAILWLGIDRGVKKISQHRARRQHVH